MEKRLSGPFPQALTIRGESKNLSYFRSFCRILNRIAKRKVEEESEKRRNAVADDERRIEQLRLANNETKMFRVSVDRNTAIKTVKQ